MMRIIQLLLLGILLFFASGSFAVDGSQVAVPRFEIKGYQVEGNTLIAQDDLHALLAPFIGTGKDFGTVQEALEKLEEAYRRRGFSMVAVTLPEQEMTNGLIRFKIIENRIRNIAVEGNRFFDQANILRSLPELQQSKTPNIRALSRSLKLANENPAKKIDLQLKNVEMAEEIDAAITVKDERPWKVGMTADNTGDKQSGRSRMGILLQHANIANRDHLLTLQYITSPENLQNVNIYSLGYRIPVYSLGSSLDLIGAYSNVNSGAINVASSDMNISGKGTILGLHYNQNFTRIGPYEHKLTLGLDYRAYQNDVEFLGNQLGNNVTVHPLSLTYAGTLSLEKMRAGLYLMGIQNLAGSWDGRDTRENFENTRAGAPSAYNMVRYGANLFYVIGGDWQARAVMNGQYTNDVLVPGEQFGIGGANSVRGFREREFASDRGYSGAIELYSPDLFRLAGISAIQTRLLFFYDRGYVRRNNPLTGETASMEIASIGPGLRITDGKRYSLAADCGFAVDPIDNNTTRWSAACHVSANILY
jgi:hemolysin activation/secretion protein